MPRRLLDLVNLPVDAIGLDFKLKVRKLFELGVSVVSADKTLCIVIGKTSGATTTKSSLAVLEQILQLKTLFDKLIPLLHVPYNS